MRRGLILWVVSATGGGSHHVITWRAITQSSLVGIGRSHMTIWTADPGWYQPPGNLEDARQMTGGHLGNNHNGLRAKDGGEILPWDAWVQAGVVTGRSAFQLLTTE